MGQAEHAQFPYLWGIVYATEAVRRMSQHKLTTQLVTKSLKSDTIMFRRAPTVIKICEIGLGRIAESNALVDGVCYISSFLYWLSVIAGIERRHLVSVKGK